MEPRSRAGRPTVSDASSRPCVYLSGAIIDLQGQVPPRMKSEKHPTARYRILLGFDEEQAESCDDSGGSQARMTLNGKQGITLAGPGCAWAQAQGPASNTIARSRPPRLDQIATVPGRSPSRSAAAALNPRLSIRPRHPHESEANQHVCLLFAASTRTPVLQGRKLRRQPTLLRGTSGEPARFGRQAAGTRNSLNGRG